MIQPRRPHSRDRVDRRSKSITLIVHDWCVVITAKGPWRRLGSILLLLFSPYKYIIGSTTSLKRGGDLQRCRSTCVIETIYWRDVNIPLVLPVAIPDYEWPCKQTNRHTIKTMHGETCWKKSDGQLLLFCCVNRLFD